MKKQVCLIGFVLGIIVILIVAKNNLSRYLLRDAEFGMQRLVTQKQVDTLFIGSSVFRQGLDMKVMEENGITDAYILSYNGNQPFAELLELKYLLDKGVKIENLYIDLYVNTMTATPWISDDKLLLDTDYQFKKELWDTMCMNNEVKITDGIQFWGTANNELLLTWPIYYPIVNSSFYKGGTLLEAKGMEIEAEEGISQGPTETEFNKVQVEAVREIARLAKDNNIKLIYLEVPQYYVMQTGERYKECLEKYVALLEEEGVDYILTESSVELIDNEECKTISFDSRESKFFSDYIHCSGEGRKLYTNKLFDIFVNDKRENEEKHG